MHTNCLSLCLSLTLSRSLYLSLCLLPPAAPGLPLAVSHSNSASGSAEVSSANYEARAFGVRAGMMMGDAKGRCPELVVVPYEFDKYDDASEAVRADGDERWVCLVRCAGLAGRLLVDDAPESRRVASNVSITVLRRMLQILLLERQSSARRSRTRTLSSSSSACVTCMRCMPRRQVYRILLAATPLVMPLSCDEAFLDLTGVTDDPEGLVASIRAQICAATGCTASAGARGSAGRMHGASSVCSKRRHLRNRLAPASAGIGPNMLLARLATRAAKPNGQRTISTAGARGVLGDLEVGELPGVGWAVKAKLGELGITHVRQVRAHDACICHPSLSPPPLSLCISLSLSQGSSRANCFTPPRAALQPLARCCHCCQVWSASKEVLLRRLGRATGLAVW